MNLSESISLLKRTIQENLLMETPQTMRLKVLQEALGVWDVYYPLVMSEQSMMIEMNSGKKVEVEHEEGLDVSVKVIT